MLKILKALTLIYNITNIIAVKNTGTLETHAILLEFNHDLWEIIPNFNMP